ncbi:spermatogenesis-associated protein 6 isoform X2 [Stegostoma tigrinum]|uniref:spermatogenesis-associated protein 6 isoform X2 n=1 Tax=Stegostoma tigrinum TaxID=3053191 RepID=UPI002870668C|nr:spermatogenesis-associated protein 6 isoform X2 [Stegostoma tigrinum]
MPKKVLRLTVHLKIQAVTCPGVFLPEKNDVYVSVCMLGRFQKTKFVPSVFPLTFNEKVKIEKNFPEAMNPGDVADILEMDTTKFELIQLTPPVGETLAIYEQNTREFLYPGRKLTPSYPGMDRELLMKRSIDFPEDSVMLELQSTPLRKPMTQSSKRKPSPCPRELSNDNSYKQPTIASQTRSLSPYTKRRMAALSEDANQRLAHLNLGPYQFKKETDIKPPFVIRHVDHKLLPTNDLYIASSSLASKPSSQKNSRLGSSIYNDPSLRGSYGPSRTSLNAIKKPHEKDLQDNSLEDTDEPIMSEPAGRQLSPATTSMNNSTTSTFQKQSPVLNRLSLRERFYPGSSAPTKWEEIHQRVLKVLKSNSARQRLDFNSSAEVNYSSDIRPTSFVNSSCDTTGHLSSVLQKNASVHLGGGDYWSNRAAAYKGRPHRAIFEESLEKIYRNMYKKASDGT